VCAPVTQFCALSAHVGGGLPGFPRERLGVVWSGPTMPVALAAAYEGWRPGRW
jgi:hypothetical protein